MLKIYDSRGNYLLDEHRDVGVGRPGAMKNRPEPDRVLLRGMLLDSIYSQSVVCGTKLKDFKPRGAAHTT